MKRRYGLCCASGVLESNFRCAVATRWAAGSWIVPGLALAGAVLVSAVLVPARAHACGAVPTPSYTIAGVSPSPGSSGVARDAGIIVTAVPSSPPGGPSEFADVELIDADTDDAVPLAAVVWISLDGPEVTMAVHPVEPLAAQHSYRVEARPLDESGTPGEPVVSSFVTSEALLEPFVLSGELELSLRGGDLDILRCGGGCSCDVDVGKRRALLADVQLPVPSGGQGAYRGALHFSDRTPTRVSTSDPLNYVISDAEPHEVRLMQFFSLEAGQALTLQQEVFEEGEVGCFTLVVWDAAGHGAQTSSCLPSLSPEDVRVLAQRDEPLDLAKDDEVAAEEVQLAVADARDNGPAVGCSMGASAPTGKPVWRTLLLASLLAVRISRRR